jgi:phospholipase C
VEAGLSADGRIRLTMANTGGAGVVLTVHDDTDRQAPWHYTIGVGDSHVADPWREAGPIDRYALTVRGPNGFMRRFVGAGGAASPEARLVLGRERQARLDLVNPGPVAATFTVTNLPGYGATTPQHFVVAPGSTRAVARSFEETDGWYDFEIRVEGRPDFLRRLAGAHGNRRTDPGIGMMRTELV